jgi:hypothetical protein
MEGKMRTPGFGAEFSLSPTTHTDLGSVRLRSFEQESVVPAGETACGFVVGSAIILAATGQIHAALAILLLGGLAEC